MNRHDIMRLNYIIQLRTVCHPAYVIESAIFSFTVRVQSSNKLLQCINLQSCSLSPGNTATLRFIGLWRERRVVVGLAVVKQEINEFWNFGNEKSIYLSINLYFA